MNVPASSCSRGSLSPNLSFALPYCSDTNPEICQMADPIFKSLVAFAVFASLLLCSSLTDASSDVAFILAHKKATLNMLKSGAERVSVTIDIYNQGTTKAALLEAYSTPILPLLDVLADRPPENKMNFVKKLLAKYGSLVSVITIVVLFVYLVARA